MKSLTIIFDRKVVSLMANDWRSFPRKQLSFGEDKVISKTSLVGKVLC